MSTLNKVTLIGNLGADPDIRTTQDGWQIANLSIGTSERWKDKNTGEQRERTEWHKVSIFSEGLAKVASQYLKKGSKVYIEGQLQTRKWQDKDGHDRYTTEIVLQGFNANLIMLSPLGDNQKPQFTQSKSVNEPSIFPTNLSCLDDEIPF